MLKNFERLFWIYIFAACLLGVYALLAHPNFGGPYAADPTLSANLELGKKLYVEKKCGSCHGDRGRTPLTNEYPVIAGQPVSYLKNQIRDIVAGHRENGLAGQMRVSVGPLTEAETLALAKYIHSL